ncbi:MAG: hypothetical protein AAGF01_07265 [Cyanobacteria bacterium P01_G01_bin.38]
MNALSAQLDTTFVEAAETLTKDDIFSRESFRTDKPRQVLDAKYF